MKGVLKQGTPRCLRRRKDCSTSLPSEAGSILQKLPFPGSSCDRGTLTKYRFSDKLCRIEFWKIKKNRQIVASKFWKPEKENLSRVPLAIAIDRGTLTKYRFSDKLCRIEFWKKTVKILETGKRNITQSMQNQKSYV